MTWLSFIYFCIFDVFTQMQLSLLILFQMFRTQSIVGSDLSLQGKLSFSFFLEKKKLWYKYKTPPQNTKDECVTFKKTRFLCSEETVSKHRTTAQTESETLHFLRQVVTKLALGFGDPSLSQECLSFLF